MPLLWHLPAFPSPIGKGTVNDRRRRGNHMRHPSRASHIHTHTHTHIHIVVAGIPNGIRMLHVSSTALHRPLARSSPSRRPSDKWETRDTIFVSSAPCISPRKWIGDRKRLASHIPLTSIPTRAPGPCTREELPHHNRRSAVASLMSRPTARGNSCRTRMRNLWEWECEAKRPAPRSHLLIRKHFQMNI
jgi:hypothetical protein